MVNSDNVDVDSYVPSNANRLVPRGKKIKIHHVWAETKEPASNATYISIAGG